MVIWRSIPLTINPEPSLGIQTVFYREKNNRRVSCLLRTKQPDNSVNCVWKQSTWSIFPSVCWFKIVRLLVNILIGPSRLCRNGGFADYPHAFKYPHNGRCFHNFWQQWDIFTQQHGRLMYKQTVKCYCKGILSGKSVQNRIF